MRELVKRIRACIEIKRPINSAMVGFAVIVALAIAVGGNPFKLGGPVLVSSFLVGFSISSSAMIMNDIIDIDIDRINAPSRPLPSGRISIREAFYCYSICIAVGLIASSLTGLDSVLVAALGSLASLAYDVKLKLAGFPGNIAVAFSTSLPFLYAFTVVDKANLTVLVFWAMVFLAVLAREIIKDIADIEGDSVKGAKTLPLIVGSRNAAFFAFIINSLAIVISPIPVIKNLVNPVIYMPMVIIVDILLLYSSLIVVIKPDKNTSIKSKKLILIAMFLGLLGFLLSAII